MSVASLANADPVSLGSAAAFTVLSASGAVNCTNSTIDGDVGSAVEGTRNSCTQIGDVFTPVSSDIREDFSSAYSVLAAEQCTNYLTTLAGQNLTPGTYCVDQASTNTGGVLTLDGGVDDTWLFKIGSSGAGALTSTDFVVEMSGAADACNVTWWVADAVTLTRGDFKGDILAGKAVTVTGVASSSPLKGRVMANGIVTLTNADALGCVAEAAARTEEAIAAALAAKRAAEEAEATALLAVVNAALTAVIGADGENIIGLTGDQGIQGDTGAQGPQGKFGPQGDLGDTGAQGPQGKIGPQGDLGDTGATGADSTVAGPTGPAGLGAVVFNSAPTSNDDMNTYTLGTVWIDTSSATAYILVDNSPFDAVWTVLGGSATGPTLYALGDAGPAGGLVFHVTDGGLHGLEAAPVDQANTKWGCIGKTISGANGTLVGTGEQNTAAIIAGCSETTAASVAAAYGPGWFLPSKDELDLFYKHMRKAALAANAAANAGEGKSWHYEVVPEEHPALLYWSSSDFSPDFAWYTYFSYGGQGTNYHKWRVMGVRAVRAF